MGIYKVDDILGFNSTYDGVKCLNCIKAEDWDEIKEEEIITLDKIEDEEIFYFCDCCKHRIQKQL